MNVHLIFYIGFEKLSNCSSTNRSGPMWSRSYYLREAEMCRSLARMADDPDIKSEYETLALKFLESALVVRDLSPSDEWNC